MRTILEKIPLCRGVNISAYSFDPRQYQFLMRILLNSDIGQYPPSGPGFSQQPQQNFGDGNDPSVKGFDFDDKTIRRAFIRKVYSILGVG